jgi:hypothetical protein
VGSVGRVHIPVFDLAAVAESQHLQAKVFAAGGCVLKTQRLLEVMGPRAEILLLEMPVFGEASGILRAADGFIFQPGNSSLSSETQNPQNFV